MPGEIITIQCGQCGNQVGYRFWDLALQEHATFNPSRTFDLPMSSFFRNVDTRYMPPLELPVRDGKSAIQSLEARAILVDMEEGVLNQLLKGPLSNLFKSKQCINGVSGSGNNWAHGHDVYGPQYAEAVADKIQSEVRIWFFFIKWFINKFYQFRQKQAEKCESLQSFLMLHSLGGGTGSGLGSYIMELLSDMFPEVQRISASVFPSNYDDVVTSPYNSLLSMRSLIEHADFVLPVENQALCDLLDKVESHNAKNAQISAPKSFKSRRHPLGKAFDGLNGIIANLLLHLTSSVRFPGSLNVDLNEISANLVPYPRLHFLVSSLSPLYAVTVEKATQKASAINQLFTDVVLPKNQLIKANPLASTYLACAFLMRGNCCNISDLNHNVCLTKQRMNMVQWNPDGFKLGLCNHPPLNAPQALLCLANNTCIRYQFKSMKERFEKLFKKRVYVHHYTQYMDHGMFNQSLEELNTLIAEYATHDNSYMAN